MNRCGPSCALVVRWLQIVRGQRLIGDDERDLERQALVVDVDHDVLDGKARRLLDALGQVPTQPARRGGRSRRDDDLVDLVVADRVHRGGERVWIADLADPLDALFLHERPGEVDANLRGVADGVVVDDHPCRGRVCGTTTKNLASSFSDRRLTASSRAAPPMVSEARTRMLGMANDLRWPQPPPAWRPLARVARTSRGRLRACRTGMGRRRRSGPDRS
jgi:hypothetical protein